MENLGILSLEEHDVVHLVIPFKKSSIIITLTLINKLINTLYCTLYRSPNDYIWGHYYY